MAKKNDFSFFNKGMKLAMEVLNFFTKQGKDAAVAISDKNGRILFLVCTDLFLPERDYSIDINKSLAEVFARVAAISGYSTGTCNREMIEKKVFSKLHREEVIILLASLGGIAIYEKVNDGSDLLGGIGVRYVRYENEAPEEMQNIIKEVKEIMYKEGYSCCKQK